MRFRPARPVLVGVAVAYGTLLLLFTGASVYLRLVAPQIDVELGFDADYVPGDRLEIVRSVRSESPARTAGLLPGDRIVAIEGEGFADEQFESRIWARHKPGDQIHLTIRRKGSDAPVALTGTFRRRLDSSWGDTLGRRLNTFFPLPFVIVGISVLFLRLEDPNVWLLAVMFGGVAVSPGLPALVPRPAWWHWATGFESISVGMIAPIFYWWCSRFPTSFLRRRLPWLKWVFWGLGAAIGVGGMADGDVALPPPFLKWLGTTACNRIADLIVAVCLAFGLASSAENFVKTRDPKLRRRIRLLFWSMVIGLGPNVLRLLLYNAGVELPFWLNAAVGFLLCLLPLAFAYAVVVHQVLEIPALIRRGARYLLVQRGFTVLLSLASIALTLVFAFSLPSRLKPLAGVDQAAGVAMGAVFGTALLWSGSQVHKRVSSKIDRAFFRGAYDARVILEALAEKSRAATDRADLARLLQFQLVHALKPSFLRIELQPELPRLEQVPECVVPILGRDGRRLGALILGPRLSEEPYSSEDRRLLASVASQAATALENMELAEEIAARLESERRIAREMEIAHEVQARLLPQAPPHLDTLECAARCVQARAVGGDYYDFLDLGPGRTGLVLADVSGKGVHAALLVAHLEAYLRSQSASAPCDPVRVLREVNRMLFLSTAPQHYATAFFAVYSEPARELVYVNCGHNPPVWLRHSGGVARLEPTATVLGAFDRWNGSSGRVRLDPGDLIAIFSDGVTEAARGEEEFGEARLIEEFAALRNCPAQAIVSHVIASVQEFSHGTQFDDLTLLVARGV